MQLPIARLPQCVFLLLVCVCVCRDLSHTHSLSFSLSRAACAMLRCVVRPRAPSLCFSHAPFLNAVSLSRAHIFHSPLARPFCFLSSILSLPLARHLPLCFFFFLSL